MEIEDGKVLAFRPNKYDIRVLNMISQSHPEIPDAAGLIRKALREYELSRLGGGMKAKVNEIWEIITSQHATVNDLLDASRVIGGEEYVRALKADCDSVEDAKQ